MILRNGLEVGARLPSERELAQHFGASRPTVGEALSMLEQRGIVKKMVGRGTFVTNMPESIVTETIERFFHFGDCSHEHLMRLREILEPEIAAMAASSATEEECRQLVEAVERYETSFARADPEGIIEHVENDIRIHQVLAVTSKNSMIVAIVTGIHNVMRRYLVVQRERWLASSHSEKAIKRALAIHRTVCEAVLARDPRAATRAMRDHMRHTRITNPFNRSRSGPSARELKFDDLGLSTFLKRKEEKTKA